MTDIEKKALALVNEVLADWGLIKNAVEIPKGVDAFACALIRAIEAHEAFRREVSDAVERVCQHMIKGGLMPSTRTEIARFIIPKPVDPLVEVIHAEDWATLGDKECSEGFRSALAARGFKIVKGEE